MKIGDKLILVSEGGLFQPRVHNLRALDVFKMLHIFQIEITHMRDDVPGDYCPDERHKGYKAKGSDGWEYECQWKRFDDTSNQPYSNWHRSYTLGTHYTTEDGTEDGKVKTWLLDEKLEFHGRYHAWDAPHTLRGHVGPDARDLAVNYINETWPDTPIAICEKKSRGRDGKIFSHGNGERLIYKGDCMWCNHFKIEVEGETS